MPEIDLLQENLKLIRRSAGWTIEELANKIGVTKQTIINLEGLKSKMTKTKIIAMYLPQYHETEDNNKWWGKGFTEWVNVKKAKPLFPGHKQPVAPLDDNYYNLLEPETIRWQIDIAKKYALGDEIVKDYIKEATTTSFDNGFGESYDHEYADREQSYNDGYDAGIEKGIETGSRKSKIEIAKSLLKNNIDINIIIDSTGITKEELNKLQ